MCLSAVRWWPGAETGRLADEGTVYILSQGMPFDPVLEPSLHSRLIRRYTQAQMLDPCGYVAEVFWGEGWFATSKEQSLRVYEAPGWDCTFQLQHAEKSEPPWFPGSYGGHEHCPLEVAQGVLFGGIGVRRLFSKQDGIWAARDISAADEAELVAAAAKHPSCNVHASADMQLGDEQQLVEEACRLTLAFSTHSVTGKIGDPDEDRFFLEAGRASLCWLQDGSGFSFWMDSGRWLVRL